MLRALEETKRRGNEAFGRGDLPAALHAYTEALTAGYRALEDDASREVKFRDLAPILAAVHANASLVELRLGRVVQSVAQASKAIFLAPNVGKWWARRACAWAALMRVHESREDCMHVLRLVKHQPDAPAAAKLRAQVTQQLQALGQLRDFALEDGRLADARDRVQQRLVPRSWRRGRVDWEDVGSEVWLHVFGLLGEGTRRAVVVLVCKTWKALAEHPRAAAFVRFGMPPVYSLAGTPVDEDWTGRAASLRRLQLVPVDVLRDGLALLRGCEQVEALSLQGAVEPQDVAAVVQNAPLLQELLFVKPEMLTEVVAGCGLRRLVVHDGNVALLQEAVRGMPLLEELAFFGEWSVELASACERLVEARCGTLDDDALGALVETCVSLRSVGVSHGEGLSRTGVRVLGKRRIREAWLGGLGQDGVALEVVKRCKGLRSLRLAGAVALTEEWAAEAAKLKQLRHLEIGEGVRVEGATDVFLGWSAPHVETLVVDVEEADGDALVGLVAACAPSLVSLEVTRATRYGGLAAALESVVAVWALGLERLVLGADVLGSAQLAVIAERCAVLQHVHVAGRSVSPQSVTYLVVHARKLESLTLQGERVGDAVLRAVVRHAKALKELRVVGASVSSVGVRLTAQGVKGLCKLGVFGCAGVQRGELARLARGCLGRGVEVVWD